MITVSEKVHEIINRISKPMTRSDILKLPFRDNANTIMYFLKKAEEKGLINRIKQEGNFYYKKSEKKYEVHNYKELKYHFLDLENLPGGRHKVYTDDLSLKSKIEENKKQMLFHQIVDLKNQKMSRSEICRRLNISRQDMINIFLFYGNDPLNELKKTKIELVKEQEKPIEQLPTQQSIKQPEKIEIMIEKEVKNMKTIGVKLRNIHTGKIFELWFDNEKDMILHVGLMCKTDFDFVERIDE